MTGLTAIRMYDSSGITYKQNDIAGSHVKIENKERFYIASARKKYHKLLTTGLSISKRAIITLLFFITLLPGGSLHIIELFK